MKFQTGGIFRHGVGDGRPLGKKRLVGGGADGGHLNAGVLNSKKTTRKRSETFVRIGLSWNCVH